MNNPLMTRSGSTLLIASRLLAGLMVFLGLSACIEAPSVQPASPPQPLLASPTQFVFPPTYTPALSGTATSTPTPRPSRTPAPTWTPASTLEPSATPLFDIQQADVDDQPIISTSLLYFDEGELRLWDHLTQENRLLDAEVFPAGLSGVSISDGGLVVAAAQVVDEGIRVYSYNRFAEEENYSSLIEASSLVELAISPGGSRVVILAVERIDEEDDAGDIEVTPSPVLTDTIEGDEITPVPSPTLKPSDTSDSDGASQVIFFWDFAAGDAPDEVALCKGECTSVIWDPLGQAVFWGDNAGLWQLDVSLDASLKPELVLEPFLVAVSARSQQTDSYLPLSISPSGRFLVVRKGILSGSVLAVVDLEEKIIESLPGTGKYTGGKTGFTWRFGDQLVIARSGIERLEIAPAIEIWNVTTVQDGTIYQLSGRYVISDDVNLSVDAPVQLLDGHVAFLTNNFRDPTDPLANGLLILDVVAGTFEQVNYLPIVQVRGVHWTLDGSGVLIESTSRILYVPNRYGQIYSVGSFLGRQACCFEWLP